MQPFLSSPGLIQVKKLALRRLFTQINLRLNASIGDSANQLGQILRNVSGPVKKNKAIQRLTLNQQACAQIRNVNAAKAAAVALVRLNGAYRRYSVVNTISGESSRGPPLGN